MAPSTIRNGWAEEPPADDPAIDPELIYAYVGVGQLVDMERNAEIVYQDALQQARSRHHEQATKALESVAPYPAGNADLTKMFTVNKWAAELLGPPLNGARFTDVRRLLLDLVSAPQYSLADDYGFLRGMSLSRDTLAPELAKVDLNQLGPDFHVPVFFFEGRQDPYCRPSLIWSYSQSINAPQKEFIWFDNSGHFPFFEEKQKFSDELFQRVLPLAADQQDAK
jgi:proline iminopeptidase